MSKKQQTIDTYNATAERMSEKFKSQGARVSDINETFALCGKENPIVLEIGCGSGRDAAEICKRTNSYLGVDISEEFIKIAQRDVPNGKFIVADIENFEFPTKLDIVFAFASLLHVPKESLRAILKKTFDALNTGGVIRISLKYADFYQESTKRDEFGIRTYYLYSQEDLRELLAGFSIIKEDVSEIRDQMWLEILAQK
jgi:SAM-dependent methyltransferase